MQQRQFFENPKLFHGGQLSVGRRKTARVLCSKRSLHVVLKAERKILRTHRSTVLAYAKKYATHSGVKIYQQSVQHDHVHLLLRIPSRAGYKRFVRALTSILARKFGRGLWKLLPFDFNDIFLVGALIYIKLVQRMVRSATNGEGAVSRPFLLLSEE